MNNRGFLYHAYALGVSGLLRGKVVEPQATSALPPTGGTGSAKWSNYQLDRFFTYDSVYTSTTGEDDGDDHQVVAKGEITSFNLGDVMVADKITVLLEAHHRGQDESQPTFTLDPKLTGFENLVIAGQVIRMTPTFPSRGASTADVRKGYSKLMASQLPDRTPIPKELLDLLRRVFAWFRREQKPKEPPVYQDVTVLPLYRIENPSIPGKFEVHGNLIRVVGFGFIQLGQLVVRNAEWRVTMVQVLLEQDGGVTEPDEAGSYALSFGGGGSGGSLSCMSVGSNGGHTDPP